MKLSSLNSVAAVLTVSLATAAHAQTVTNPFMAQPLSTIVVADNHEGKCGEGKCGGMKETAKEGKCGEGKCGSKMKSHKEGKCGEGKCGGKMMEADTNKDGNISKTEFMSRHEAMFNEADTNKDGMLDASEHKALHKAKNERPQRRQVWRR